MVNKYFAYGSNMNPARVAERGLVTHAVSAGQLFDFTLVFNKVSRLHPHLAHANIQRAQGAAVEGVLYTLTAPEEIHKMDPFEHAPWNYGRDVVWIETPTGGSWAWTYFANRAVVNDGLRPPTDYLAHLLAGEAYLSQAYLAWLQTIPTADP